MGIDLILPKDWTYKYIYSLTKDMLPMHGLWFIWPLDPTFRYFTAYLTKVRYETKIKRLKMNTHFRFEISLEYINDDGRDKYKFKVMELYPSFRTVKVNRQAYYEANTVFIFKIARNINEPSLVSPLQTFIEFGKIKDDIEIIYK